MFIITLSVMEGLLISSMIIVFKQGESKACLLEYGPAEL